MDCIPYINDLLLEIEMLEKINNDDIEINLKIKQKKDLIRECKENLSNLSKDNIEYRLYVNILHGLSPTKAVEKVAEENYYNNKKPTSISRIWEYYKKMQKKVKTGVKQE